MITNNYVHDNNTTKKTYIVDRESIVYLLLKYNIIYYENRCQDIIIITNVYTRYIKV